MIKANRLRMVLALSVFAGLSQMPGHCEDFGTDDAGQFKSVTATRLAREALSAARQGNWPVAEQKYAQATREKADASDLYYGLYQAAAKTNDWNQAYSALESIFSSDPDARQNLQAEYGETLTGIGRFEEAVPVLKKALLVPDANANYLDRKLVALSTKIMTAAPKSTIDPTTIRDIHADLPKFEAPPEIDPSTLNLYTSDKALNYETLFSHSEFIAVCTYERYEKDRGSETSFYHPPIAIYHIDTILKGPPIKYFPVRYAFTDGTATAPPADWKFDSSKLPKKGEKFLMFVENAIPLRNAYETFRGSYGRQPATDANLNAMYKIIEEHRGQQ